MTDTLLWDADRDILHINGVAYSVQLFRRLALAEPGTWLRITERTDGVLTIYTPGPDVCATFDAITGQGRAR